MRQRIMVKYVFASENMDLLNLLQSKSGSQPIFLKCIYLNERPVISNPAFERDMDRLARNGLEVVDIKNSLR
jgi:hypothetical protein